MSLTWSPLLPQTEIASDGCSNIFSPLPFGWDVLLCLGTSETRDKAAIKLGLMYAYRQQAEGLQSPE